MNGRIDVLVNNSGVSIGKPLLEQTAEDFDAVVDVNLRGAFLVATEVARRMRVDGKGGSIINIESILSFRQAGQIAPYAASKAGLTQLTRSMALELARYKIRVNGIAPGYFATDINREFFDTEAGAQMIAVASARRARRIGGAAAAVGLGCFELHERRHHRRRRRASQQQSLSCRFSRWEKRSSQFATLFRRLATARFGLRPHPGLE